MGVKSTETLFTKLTFKYFPRNGAYTKDEFINQISKTAFKEYDMKKKGIGLRLYLRKELDN